MSNGRIRKKAEEMAGYGYSRQHMYDALVMEHPEVERKRIAQVVRYVPSEAMRSRYAPFQQGLLAAIGLTALLHLAERWTDVSTDWRSSFAMIQALPIASIFLGVALFRWRGEALPWLAFVNAMAAFGLASELNDLLKGEPAWYTFLSRILALVIALLAWHLYHKVFGKPEKIKDPLGHAPPTYLFPQEPGLYKM